MPKDRELRVEKKLDHKVTHAKDGPRTLYMSTPGVWLECSEDGRVGDFTPEMVARMREAEAAMREASDTCALDPELSVAAESYAREADDWGRICKAIDRVLKTGGNCE